MGDMGTLTFTGEDGSGPIGAWDDVMPTANEEAHHGVAGLQLLQLKVQVETKT